MSLDNALQTSMETIPECLAAGYIDMTSGMLLGVQSSPEQPQDVLEALAAATADLFQGRSISEIEAQFSASRTDGMQDVYFQEIIVFSADFLHLFLRTDSYPDHVICYVCDQAANPGLVLAKAKMTLGQVAAAV